MRAVIIEDEIIAAQNLKRLIHQINSDIQIVAILQSIEDSIKWFSSETMPDLVFLDIHLSDGSAFAIFEKVNISAPIIFTTAYDEYALRAFKVNSIDYLLKPIDHSELKHAIEKYTRVSASSNTNINTNTNTISNTINPDYLNIFSEIFLELKKEKGSYKSNFLLPFKDKFIPLSINKIAYFYSENKIAKIVTTDNQIFYENSSLDEIYKQIDPSLFFRANRQFIVSHKSIKDISSWFDNRLSIGLCVPTPENIIISRNKVAEFRNWYTAN